MNTRFLYLLLATATAPTRPVKALLSAMQQRSHIKLSDLSSAWKVLPQRMVEIPLTAPVSRPPEGMVRIPAGNFKLEVEEASVWGNDGLGVQYPWEDKPTEKHSKELALKSFYIDKIPVTCAEFKRFLDATHYRPAGSEYYFPQARQLNQHGKYWLLADSTDRSATIGFRCIVDAE